MSENENIEHLKAQLDKLHTSNSAIIADLRTRHQVAPDPKILLQIRLEMLLDAMFDEEERYAFEIDYSKRVAEILQAIGQEQTKKGLLIPSQTPLRLP